MPGVWRIDFACAVSLCKTALHTAGGYNHDSFCQISEQGRSKPVATRVQSFFPQSYPHVLCITRRGGAIWKAPARSTARRQACRGGRGPGIPRLSTACRTVTTCNKPFGVNQLRQVYQVAWAVLWTNPWRARQPREAFDSFRIRGATGACKGLLGAEYPEQPQTCGAHIRYSCVATQAKRPCRRCQSRPTHLRRPLCHKGDTTGSCYNVLLTTIVQCAYARVIR